MRKKEPCYVISFTSTADAILFEKKAQVTHLSGRLIPLPPVISAGCGMAWKITKADVIQLQASASKKQEADGLLSVIHTLCVPIEKIHELLL